MEKKLDFEVKDGKLIFRVDPNKDGQPVIVGKVHLGEAFQEAFAKGTAIEGAKVVSVKFNMTKLEIKIDTDKDGEPLLELEVDLAEAVDEVQDMLAKKKE